MFYLCRAHGYVASPHPSTLNKLLKMIEIDRAHGYVHMLTLPPFLPSELIAHFSFKNLWAGFIKVYACTDIKNDQSVVILLKIYGLAS